MTTWIEVNLPWKAGAPFRRPDRPFTHEMRAWCGGKTYQEFCHNQSEKNRQVWAREDIDPTQPNHGGYLSEAGRAELEKNNEVCRELWERILATPEMREYENLCARLHAEYEASYFSNKLKVGMYIEFSDGKRLLVGDINEEGVLGGCCPEDIDPNARVLRYTMIELPKG